MRYRHEPIILIDDDANDLVRYRECLADIGSKHPLRTFTDSTEALSFLLKTDEMPYMIVLDLGMPKLNGIEFRARLRKSKHILLRCVPFFYLSTTFDQKQMDRSFEMMVQGTFIKPDDPEKLKEIFRSMLSYSAETAPLYPN